MKKKSLLFLTISTLAVLTACQGSKTTNSTLPSPTDFVRTETSTEVPVSTPTQIPTPTVRTEKEENSTDTDSTKNPTCTPTLTPTTVPTATVTPTEVPTLPPTSTPTSVPVEEVEPTVAPTEVPSVVPTETPVVTVAPTSTPTPMPTVVPTETPVVTVEPTKAPTPTVKPTVAPTATPKPTPIPGDDVGVTFGEKVTLDSGVNMSVLTDYNNAGIYSKDTSIYGWYGDGQDNRDNTAQKDKEMDALEDAIGVTRNNGTGFYVSNFSTEFYWDSAGSTPDLALYRDVDNQCYYLAINYDISTSRRGTEGARDVLRMLLSICSSNPIELEELIYTDCFVEIQIPENDWVSEGDSMVSFTTNPPVSGLSIYIIKSK